MVFVTSVKQRLRVFVTLLFALVSVLGVGLTALQPAASSEAGVIEKVVCWFGQNDEKSLPVLLYKSASTDMPFSILASKSGVSVSQGRVESDLNAILQAGAPEGTDFKTVNERILGRPLYEVKASKEKAASTSGSSEKPEFNAGPRVSPYDRFGVMGLQFTNYNGEWRYIEPVNVCSSGGGSNLDRNTFYSSRKTVQDTYWASTGSDDIRASQRTMARFAVERAFMTITAQMIFWVTKFFVTLVIGLVNFAFTDLVAMVGIDDIVASDSGSGIAPTLYHNLFVPMISLIMVVTGCYILYFGIVKRQIRESLGVLFRSIALFICATIVFTNASTFMKIPNNVALVGQAMVMEALGGGVAGGGGLCTSDLGTTGTSEEKKFVESGPQTLDAEESRGILEKAAITIRSQVGCQFWQMFLLRPYVQAQWGTDWEQLWDKSAEVKYTTSTTAGTLPNDNGDMVGDAAVPLGNGEFINNWAIFQISTQTNAHSPINKDGEKDNVINDKLSSDWWRIVDAVSNYQEKEQKYTVTGLRGQVEETATHVPDPDAKVTPYWGAWTGNTSLYSRVGISLSSIFIAVIGLFAPFVLAFASAIISIKISLLMAVSPIAFLLGCYPKGYEFFKGWAESVLNSTIERILVGLTLSLSLVFTSAALDIMSKESWFKGLILLIVMSFAIFKVRKKLVEALASFRFSASGFSQVVNRTSDMVKGAVKGTASVAGAGAVGARSSAKAGGSLKEGFKSAAGRQLRNKAYSSNSEVVRRGMISYENEHFKRTGKIQDLQGDFINCQVCGREIDVKPGSGTILARDDDGNFICQSCYDEGVNPDAQEITLDRRETHSKDESAVVSTSTAKSLNGEEGVNNALKLDDPSTTLSERKKLLDQFTSDIGTQLAKTQNIIISGSEHDHRFVLPDQLKPYIDERAFNDEVAKLFDVDRYADEDGEYDKQAAREQMLKVLEPISLALQKHTQDRNGRTYFSRAEVRDSIIVSYNAGLTLPDTYKV